MTVNPAHPLLHSLINTLRDTALSPLEFRHCIGEITKLLAYEALHEFPSVSRTIVTWNGPQEYRFIDESSIMVVSVLRAALPMHESLIGLISDAISGFLGIKRDETSHESILYYDRVGECNQKTVIVVDPMVATGGSLCDAIEIVKSKGAEKIISLNIIAAPEGLKRVSETHPDVMIVVGQIDEGLSADKFILPGLGDAGDRAFNTI